MRNGPVEIAKFVPAIILDLDVGTKLELCVPSLTSVDCLGKNLATKTKFAGAGEFGNSLLVGAFTTHHWLDGGRLPRERSQFS